MSNGMYHVLDWGHAVREFGTLTDALAFAEYVSAREHMAIKVVDSDGKTVATADRRQRYCAEPCCTARPTQRITTRVDGPTYSRRYDDDYCTKHAAEAIAELGGGDISLIVSIVALPPLMPAARVGAEVAS